MPKIFDLLLETAKQQEDAAIKDTIKKEDPKLRKLKDRALMTIIYKILESKK